MKTNEIVLHEKSNGKYRIVLFINENEKKSIIKYLSKDIIKSDFATQLENERQFFLNCKHSNIVELEEIIKNEKDFGLKISLAEGASIAQILSVYKKFSINFTRMIAYQTIEIFEYIHSKGYIYRDLKASHVIINSAGKLKLVDFGLSKNIMKTNMRANSFCGTYHSMAPEILLPYVKKEEINYTFSADYYSIGVLIYEMITGSPPFGLLFDNSPESIHKYARTLEESTIDLSPIQSEEAKDILIIFLDKNPEARIYKGIGLKEIKSLKFFSEIKNSIENYIQDNISEFEEYLSYIDVAGFRQKCSAVFNF